MTRSKEPEGVLENAMQVAKEQAEDEGLWFISERITERVLQDALRRLAAAVEGTIYRSLP